jgi:hypothetical protein
MTLDNVFMAAVRMVNAMEPEARSAVLPIRDVETFRESVARAQQERQSRKLPEGQQPPKEMRKETEIPEPDIPDLDAHTFAPPSIS